MNEIVLNLHNIRNLCHICTLQDNKRSFNYAIHMEHSIIVLNWRYLSEPSWSRRPSVHSEGMVTCSYHYRNLLDFLRNLLPPFLVWRLPPLLDNCAFPSGAAALVFPSGDTSPIDTVFKQSCNTVVTLFNAIINSFAFSFVKGVVDIFK